MKKDFEYIELFELYKGLLTERQRELFESHLIYDLSLSEIAEPEGTTRQNVYEAIKKVKAKLDEYESKLKLNEKYTKLAEISKGSELEKEIIDIIKG